MQVHRITRSSQFGGAIGRGALGERLDAAGFQRNIVAKQVNAPSGVTGRSSLFCKQSLLPADKFCLA